MLNQEILFEYNKIRTARNKEIFCHAPFACMNFDQNGHVTVCCYNRTYILGTYPNDTLKNIWFGQKAEQLREFMKKNLPPAGCEICYTQFQSKNFGGLRAQSYDFLADREYPEREGILTSMPKVLEFEISNVCNLECVMCSGHFSSSIRKNVEKLPPLNSPYDKAFVKQLEAFIPHLVEARFLGGEPFLINTYYQIWDLITRLNTNIKVVITTNGTILNNRVKDVLEKLNVNIIISIDSLEKENYERIRKNAKFDQVMDNFQYFREYVKRKNTSMCFTVCPMQQNWKEIPRLLEFCNKQDIHLYFNTVVYPKEASLETIGYEKLCEIVDYLKAKELTHYSRLHKNNNSKYQDLINQIIYYKENASDKEHSTTTKTTYPVSFDNYKRLTPSQRPVTSMLRDWSKEFAINFLHQLQMARLRTDRLKVKIIGGRARRRVMATACWNFPIYSQTFVYQELTQLIKNGYDVRFLYSKLNSRDQIPAQFTPLWRARRKLILHTSVFMRDFFYYAKRMPEKIDMLINVLCQASGMSPQDIRNHYHFLQAFAFTRMVEAYKPDYLHSYFFYEGSLFTLVASFLLDIPRGVSCYADHLLKDYDLKVVPLHLEQCSLIIATSERIKRELISIASKINQNSIIVKPNAINVKNFPPFRRKEPEPERPYRLICVSRIEPKKGLLYLVESVRFLLDQNFNVELHHIGGIDDNATSKAYARDVENRVKELKLDSKIHFEGRRTESDIKGLLAISHVFVAPFVETESGDKDGIPTSLLEAMSTGIPVVATNAGSVPEVIDNGYDGILVTQRDSNALAIAIAHLIKDFKQRERLGNNAVQKVRLKYDVSVCEHIFHDRLSKLLSSRNGKSSSL